METMCQNLSNLEVADGKVARNIVKVVICSLMFYQL